MKQGRRYERTEQLVQQVLADKQVPGERLQAWSFTQGIMSPGSRIIIGAGAVLYMRPFILAATDQRVFRLQLSMKNKYEVVKADIFPIASVHVYKNRRNWLAPWAWSAQVGMPDGFYRFIYSPTRKWFKLGTVLDYIQKHR